MKTQSSSRAGLIVLLYISMVATSTATEGWYVPESSAKGTFGSVTVGAAHNHDLKHAWDDGSISNTKTDVTDPAIKLTGGYQVNQYLAVQAAYHYLGKHTMSATSDGSGNSWDAGPVSGEQEAEGWSMSVSGRLPISERWTFVGTIGWLWWTSEERYNESGALSSIKEEGGDFTMSGHFEFDHGLRDRIVYVAGLDHQRVGDDNYDITTGFAGVLYIFP